MAEIKEARRKGYIDKNVAQLLIEQTKENYEVTQRAKEERLKKRAEKSRRKSEIPLYESFPEKIRSKYCSGCHYIEKGKVDERLNEKHICLHCTKPAGRLLTTWYEKYH